MAKAYACDRCGDLFKSKDLNYHVDVVLECNVPFPMTFCKSNGNEILSLCPKCRAGFQKWWNEEAVNKTTDFKYKYVNTLYETEEDSNDN